MEKKLLLDEYRTLLDQELIQNGISTEIIKFSYTQKIVQQYNLTAFVITIDELSFSIFIHPTSSYLFKYSYIHYDDDFTENPVMPEYYVDFEKFDFVLSGLNIWIYRHLKKYLIRVKISEPIVEFNLSDRSDGIRINKTVLLPDYKSQIIQIIKEYNHKPTDFKFEQSNTSTFYDDSFYGVNKLIYKNSPMCYYILIDEDNFEFFKYAQTSFNTSFSQKTLYFTNDFDQINIDFREWLGGDLRNYIRHIEEPDPFAELTESKLFQDEKQNELLTENEIILLSNNLDQLKEYIESKDSESTQAIMLRNDVALDIIYQEISELKILVQENKLSKNHLGKLIKSSIEGWSMNKMLDGLWGYFLNMITTNN